MKVLKKAVYGCLALFLFSNVSAVETIEEATERFSEEAKNFAIEKLGRLQERVAQVDKNSYLSTEITSIKDIPDNVDYEIQSIKEQIKGFIFAVATDIEKKGQSGKVTIKDSSIEYKQIIEAQKSNNVSVRSVQLAMKLLADVNNDLITKANEATSPKEKRHWYITQAAYVYEMSDIVLQVLNDIQLEGNEVINNIKSDNEGRARQRIQNAKEKLEKVERLKNQDKISSIQYTRWKTKAETFVSANEQILTAWKKVMDSIGDQEEWLIDIRSETVSVELVKEFAYDQLGLLRDTAILADLIDTIGPLDDLIQIAKDLPLLSIDSETIKSLIQIEYDVPKNESKVKF